MLSKMTNPVLSCRYRQSQWQTLTIFWSLCPPFALRWLTVSCVKDLVATQIRKWLNPSSCSNEQINLTQTHVYNPFTLIFSQLSSLLSLPQGDLTWTTMLGQSVRLQPVPIQSLSELERARLQEVALYHLEERDLDFKISLPKGTALTLV